MTLTHPPDEKANDAGVTHFISTADRESLCLIAFAWNGKHAAEFIDANQQFRFAVVEHICSTPGDASIELLAALFRESSLWAVEAWGSPPHFGELGALLLTRGGETVLPDFLVDFTRSFDTFGACHAMQVDPVILRRLLLVSTERRGAASEAERMRWEAGVELFTKLTNGTASLGWASVPPGTKVTSIRVVPQWRLGLNGWLKRATCFFSPREP
jgi:hypothetical protein